jgi:hypothetical protein
VLRIWKWDEMAVIYLRKYSFIAPATEHVITRLSVCLEVFYGETRPRARARTHTHTHTHTIILHTVLTSKYNELKVPIFIDLS